MQRLLSAFVLSLALGALVPARAQSTETSPRDKLLETLQKLEQGGDGISWDDVAELETLGGDIERILPGEAARLGPRGQLASARLLLGRNDRAAIEILRGLVTNGAAPVALRSSAAELLAARGRRDDVQGLEPILDQPEEPLLKIAVARAVWSLGRNRKGTEVLKSYLGSDDPEVRIEATLALGEVGNVEAVKDELKAIAKEPTARGGRARLLLEREELYRQIETTSGLDRDPFVKQLQEKIADLEAERDKLRELAARKGSGGDPLLSEIQQLIQKYYVDEAKTDEEGLVAGAANGMVHQLGDPFSSFMNEAATENFERMMRQEYAGIGAIVSSDPRSGFLMVVRPIYNGPAFEAGLRSRDLILSIDGTSTQGKSADDLVSNLKGPEGSTVSLEVKAAAWPEPRSINLERRKIHLPSVSWASLPGNLGYLRLSQFGHEAVQQVEDALQELEKVGMVGLIFDLRSNPGGLLEAAVDIADKFLKDDKLIVYSEGRNPEIAPKHDYRTKDAATHPPYPIVVLVDGHSASASEVVSGALRDHDRAVLVGEKTFGKGSVQQLLPLRSREGKARLRLTIAYYYLPSGELIHGKGVFPHVTQAPGEGDPTFPAALAGLEKSGALDAYFEHRSPDDWATLTSLAEFDGRDPARYPGFDEWYAALQSPVEREHARRAVRERVRSRVQDERAREFACDAENDVQLQRGILELLGRLGDDMVRFPEYAGYPEKFRAQDHNQGGHAEGK